MDREEEIVHVRKLITKHQKNIHAVEEILANYGVDRPIHILNSLTFEQESIKKLQDRLQKLESPFEIKKNEYEVTCLQNLPRRLFFVGRENEINTILGSLEPASRTFIVSVEGLGGVGKTSLAIEAAYRCLEEKLFASIIWVSAKETVLTITGIEEQTPELKALKDIFSAIGQVLNYPSIGNASLEEQSKISYDLLSKQTTLLLIDNFEALSLEERDQIVNFLRKTPITVKSIITSRERIAEGHRVQLKGLLSDESKKLLQWSASQHATRLTNEQVQDIIDVTGGSPLAMLWVEGQVAMFGQAVSQVLERLEFSSDIPLLKFCFERSWNLLELEAQQILIVLALHIDPASRNALKYIVEGGESEGYDNALTHVYQLSLVIHNHELDRFSLLPLTRKFVLTQSKHKKTFINKANQRMAQYYLNFVSHRGGFQNWRDYDQLLLDRDNILAASQWCYRTLQQKKSRGSTTLSYAKRKVAEMLIKFAQTFGSVLWQRAYWLERLSLTHAALEAAQLLEDWKGVSGFSRNITWIYFYQGNCERAQYWAEASLQAALKTNDILFIAAAKRALGTVVIRLGKFDLAKQLLLEAIDICQEHKDDDYAIYSLGFSLYGMGDLKYEMQDYDAAVYWYQEAIKIWQLPTRQDPIRHTSIGFNGLGFVALEQGQLEQATQYFSNSIEAAGEVSRQEETARAKLGLAQIAVKRNDIETGIKLAQEALEIFKQLGMQREIHLAQGVIDLSCQTK
ncbi:tetratricopeptide repeat protein [Calothrix membranacea FACHB-236]|nr:tetratricopeptide repeat protein [Calothrix membranacea FACHB-236]